jgi:hypothetical protein
MGQAMLKKVTNQAVGDEGGNQDIGVQKDLHETCSKMS